MSEEEAIKILRDIPFFEQVENYDVNGPKYILKTNKRLSKARDMVLDLYQKEKEKNKELEKENERLKYLLTESGKIIDEYTNELENDTKKIIEYREKYLEKRIKNDK